MSAPADPRLRAFLSEHAPEVFHSIQGRNTLWQPDPFDVEDIHDEARDEFERLLSRALCAGVHDSGRILLLLGDSGCGKTHLIRAFRASVQEGGRGYLGYLQMTTGVSHYPRYLLSNLIDSLDQVYNAYSDVTGLQHLSNALFAACPTRLKDLLTDAEQLSDEGEVHDTVRTVADSLLAREEFGHLDMDLVRALIYLQRREDGRLKHRVLKYLRCEDLSSADRALLGDMVPRLAEDDPVRMVRHLGLLMGALGQALVLAVDQVEDSYEEGDPRSDAAFRSAIQTLRDVTDRTPRCVVVLSCLHNFWTKQRQKLTQALLDRIERDPDPVGLENLRSAEEARQLAERRLRVLYEEADVDFDAATPTFPFPLQGFEKLSGLRTRDVLDALRTWREAALARGALPAHFPLEQAQKGGARPEDSPPPPGLPELDGLWNDFRSAWREAPPEEDGPLLQVLKDALGLAGAELGVGVEVHTPRGEEGLEVRLGSAGPALKVGLCNKSTRGGGLARQLERLREGGRGRTVVALRSTPFPDSPGTSAVEQLGLLVKEGGRRVVLEDAEVRALCAFSAFLRAHGGRPDFSAWACRARPLSQLRALAEVLDAESLLRRGASTRPITTAARSQPPPEKPASPRTQESRAFGAMQQDAASGPLRLGTSGGLLAEGVSLAPEELTQHAAFLGGTGSGKTTLALNLVEQLLLRGVPAVLVDRKGDLAGYAREGLAGLAGGDAARAERLAALEARVDVALFTPGDPRGRPLGIGLVPDGLARASEHEREEVSIQAANALAGMLGYGEKGRDAQCRTALAQALGLLMRVHTEPHGLTLERAIGFIESRDPSLLQRVGRLDERVLGRLVQDLETFRLNARTLLSEEGERLEVDALLGRGVHARPGRTRLSILSTKFLGDTSRTLFWVAQLLSQVVRWCDRHPSGALQAVMLFDEADLYLPAVGRPATKPLMEGLLKRARSAGVGLMLATQSPGDFDYKCRDNIRTWCVGRVREENSLKKLRPLLSDAGAGLERRLPGHAMGEFLVLRGGRPEPLRADPSGLRTEQLAEEVLLTLARRTREAQTSAPAQARVGS